MLKKSLMILSVLFAVPTTSTADIIGNLTGLWNGVMVEGIAGFIPGANVDTTVIVDKLSISNEGIVTGTATRSLAGSTTTLEGKIDPNGEFTLPTNDEAEECQISGTAKLLLTRAELIGYGTCGVKQQDGNTIKIYESMSAILSRFEPN